MASKLALNASLMLFLGLLPLPLLIVVFGYRFGRLIGRVKCVLNFRSGKRNKGTTLAAAIAFSEWRGAILPLSAAGMLSRWQIQFWFLDFMAKGKSVFKFGFGICRLKHPVKLVLKFGIGI